MRGKTGNPPATSKKAPHDTARLRAPTILAAASMIPILNQSRKPKTLPLLVAHLFLARTCPSSQTRSPQPQMPLKKNLSTLNH